MLEHLSPQKRNGIYIAIVVGAFWTLASFLPIPQMSVLYLLEASLESFNIEAATTKNIIYLAALVIFATLYYTSRSKTGMVFSAIGVTFFMTPLFAYYDNIIPQEPYFMLAFLCGVCATLVLSTAGLLKKDTKTAS